MAIAIMPLSAAFRRGVELEYPYVNKCYGLPCPGTACLKPARGDNGILRVYICARTPPFSFT